MLDRKVKFDSLCLAFSNFSSYIQINSKAGFFDTNKAMETVLIDILNITYSKSYKNLNIIKHNHPAIDLGCPISKTAVQITSDGSTSKINSTMIKFTEYGLDKQYSSVIFMVITTQPYSTSTSYTIKNLSDLASDIFSLDDARFQQVYDYIRREFSSFFPMEQNPDVVTLITSTSLPPFESIPDFIASQMDWAAEEGITDVKIRDDIIALKNTLADLSEQERGLIYRVLSQGTSGNYSYTIPWPVLSHNLWPNQARLLKGICDSLAYKKMLYIDDEEEDYPVTVSYFTDITDFDYFKAITDYFLKKHDGREKLKKVIIDCDFTHIK
ncbi:SMEK domain-containing protein [Aeromonas allosaccharophila]|uniref:SMEK domain-containing protein n=1 Tax=Aeromonas allosaccharophila TaxID=656 RepID=UPI001BCFD845|nr:SMEK domain-containing protein [Aeromonas allosaccharophila]MBS4697873.1 SMEK domain-containing protein [Aeromonas allosaccharophila]